MMRRTKSLTGLALLLVAVGCSQSEPATLAFRMAEEGPAPGLTEMVHAASGDTLYLHEQILVDESHVQSATVLTREGHSAIAVEFTPDGAQRFAEATEANVGKRCAMIVNGQLVSAPHIREAILGGRAMITGDFTESEASRIADGLTAR